MNHILLILALLGLLLAALHLLAPSLVARAYLNAARLGAGMASQEAEVNGQVFHYLEGGSGQTIVLIHGFGADADNWLFLSRSLRGHFRVIAPDLPGFGDSPPPGDGNFSVPSQAERLADFIAALTTDKVHLVGNSMGGQIVALLAARRPELVRSVALFDPLGVESEAGVQKSLTMQRLDEGLNVLLPTNGESFSEMMSLMFYREPWIPGALKRYYRDRWLESRGQLAKVFADITTQYVPLRPLLPDISAPVLVLWGAEDEILPAGGASILSAGLRQSEVVIIPQCGHLPMLEKPRITAAHYLGFLDSLQTE